MTAVEQSLKGVAARLVCFDDTESHQRRAELFFIDHSCAATVHPVSGQPEVGDDWLAGNLMKASLNCLYLEYTFSSMFWQISFSIRLSSSLQFASIADGLSSTCQKGAEGDMRELVDVSSEMTAVDI